MMIISNIIKYYQILSILLSNIIFMNYDDHMKFRSLLLGYVHNPGRTEQRSCPRSPFLGSSNPFLLKNTLLHLEMMG
jgi:hypothetical protein